MADEFKFPDELDAKVVVETPDDDIEIDDHAATSEADNGFWVAAWVWMRREEPDDEMTTADGEDLRRHDALGLNETDIHNDGDRP